MGLQKLQSMKGKFDMPKDRLAVLEKENATLNKYIQFFDGDYRGTDPLVDAKMLFFQNNLKMTGELDILKKALGGGSLDTEEEDDSSNY